MRIGGPVPGLRPQLRRWATASGGARAAYPAMAVDWPAQVEGLRYWDLHGFLLLPTLWLLTTGRPEMLQGESGGTVRARRGELIASSTSSALAAPSPVRQQAAFSYLGFILFISVAQAFIWDTVGAEIGIWEFNAAKCTDLGEASVLPLEEVAWLFHHVMKAALWQLKVAELPMTRATGAPATMPAAARWGGNAALLAMTWAGVSALTGDDDSLKCVGLVAAFFAPVFLIVFNLGSRHFASHWRLFLLGWLPPGLWTVVVDCIGQQQDVWYFPPRYLTGIAAVDGLLKLDIAAVYLVSTFAVTATGAIILAAEEELQSEVQEAPKGLRAAQPVDTAAADAARSGSDAARSGSDAARSGSDAGAQANLWDLLLLIVDGAFPTLATWPSRRYLDRFAGRAASAKKPPQRRELV
jgi:hypothetical protein